MSPVTTITTNKDTITNETAFKQRGLSATRSASPLVRNLPKFSVCGNVGFIKCGLSTTDKTIRFYFQIIETLFPVWGIPCGSGLPGTLYAAIPKMGTERIHSDQPPAVRVYFGGRSLGLIFICAGFSTQSSSFFSLIPPKFTAPQRHREDSLKVEAASL